jgi:hypothetical protein
VIILIVEEINKISLLVQSQEFLLHLKATDFRTTGDAVPALPQPPIQRRLRQMVPALAVCELEANINISSVCLALEVIKSIAQCDNIKFHKDFLVSNSRVWRFLVRFKLPSHSDIRAC